MKVYQPTSRFYSNIEYGYFQNQLIVYPPVIDYKNLTLLNSHTIKSNEEFKPDAISLAEYGDPNWLWAIMGFNQFDSVSELYLGRVIGIPDITAING